MTNPAAKTAGSDANGHAAPGGYPLLFDREEYCASLTHVGRVSQAPGLSTSFLIRPVPDAEAFDAVGPWPYCSPPSPGSLRGALDALQARSLVSFMLFIRPDGPPDPDALPDARVRVDPLKEHYVLDPDRPRPEIRRRTRRNLALAARSWRIEALPRHRLATLGPELHGKLAARRGLSVFADAPPRHYAALARLDGIAAMAATDQAGAGAVLVAARGGGETHLLHLLTDPRAIPACAAHLLMDTALDVWSADGPVYMGGAPAGPDGPGVARFKARWSNRTAPVVLLKAVLDAGRYARLAARRGPTDFFPAYRAPQARDPA